MIINDHWKTYSISSPILHKTLNEGRENQKTRRVWHLFFQPSVPVDLWSSGSLGQAKSHEKRHSLSWRSIKTRRRVRLYLQNLVKLKGCGHKSISGRESLPTYGVQLHTTAPTPQDTSAHWESFPEVCLERLTSVKPSLRLLRQPVSFHFLNDVGLASDLKIRELVVWHCITRAPQILSIWSEILIFGLGTIQSQSIGIIALALFRVGSTDNSRFRRRLRSPRSIYELAWTDKHDDWPMSIAIYKLGNGLRIGHPTLVSF